MKVIFQERVWEESGYEGVINSFEKLFEVEIVEFRPFQEKIDLDYIPDACFGSTRFIDIAAKQGFPIFDPCDMNWEASCRSLPFLNHFRETKIKNLYASMLNKPHVEYFIKPKKEKLFTAGVLQANDLKEKTIDEVIQFQGCDDIMKEEVCFCDVKNLTNEYRFIILNGEVVCGSLYRSNGIKKEARIKKHNQPWIAAKKIVESSNNIPNGSLDICFYNGSWKVIEMNNLNSCGLYSSDSDAFAQKLYKYLQNEII